VSPQLIKYFKEIDSFKAVLKEHGFEDMQYFWYNDGCYSSGWDNMSISNEKPDHDGFTMWQFGFKSSKKDNKRIKLEALNSGELGDHGCFRFELRYYPDITLHDKGELMGPGPYFIISSIYKEDLTDLQKYIDFLLNPIGKLKKKKIIKNE